MFPFGVSFQEVFFLTVLLTVAGGAFSLPRNAALCCCAEPVMKHLQHRITARRYMYRLQETVLPVLAL